MNTKKILSALCLLLLVFALTLSVSAANNNAIGFTMESSDSIVSAGKTFTADFKVNNNTGFVWAQASIIFDPNAITVESWTAEGGAFSVVSAFEVPFENNLKELRITIGSNTSLFDPANAPVYNQTGKVLTVTFKVAAGYEKEIKPYIYYNDDAVVSSANDKNYDITVTNPTYKAVDWATHKHTKKELARVEPTCEDTGLTYGEYCTYCEQEYLPQETISALGHLKDVEIPAVAPTCTDTGLTKGYKCSRCGVVSQAQETVGALGHLKDVKIPAKAPTCIATGLTEGARCSRCGTITVEQQTVPMVEHTMPEKWTQTKAPTCLDKGEEQRVCTTEGCTKTETREIKALGHDWDKVAAEAPTCSKEGKKELWTCKVCKAVDAEKNGAPVAKLPHTPGVLAAKAPTCTDTGLTEGSYCLVCTEVITAQKVLAVVPHNMTESFVNDNADKHWKECEDCGYKTEEGAHTLEKGVCTVCGYGCKHKGGTATCSKKAVCEICGMQYGNKKAHTPGAAATCETDQICTVCNAVVKKATGHKFVDHEAKDPTCTDKGNKAYQTCENCDYSTFEEIAAFGHKLVNHEAKAATCAEIGWDAYETCENCDHTTYKEIAATGNHTYDNDCDVDCNVCAEKRTPADHKYGDWEIVKEATTKEEGEKKHTCSVCGNSESEKIPMVEPEGLPTWLILVIALGVVAVVVIIIVVAKKKK